MKINQFIIQNIQQIIINTVMNTQNMGGGHLLTLLVKDANFKTIDNGSNITTRSINPYQDDTLWITTDDEDFDEEGVVKYITPRVNKIIFDGTECTIEDFKKNPYQGVQGGLDQKVLVVNDVGLEYFYIIVIQKQEVTGSESNLTYIFI